MPVWLAITLGGGLGALMRHEIGMLFPSTNFPLATITINATGAFLLAILTEWMALRGHLPQEVRAFLTIGFLGSFTTFSRYTMETFLLIERGHYGYSALYAFGSIAAGLLAFGVGLVFMRFLLT